MKKLRYLILLTMLISLVGCGKTEIKGNIGTSTIPDTSSKGVLKGDSEKDYYGIVYTMTGNEFLEYCKEILPNGYAKWGFSDYEYHYINDYMEVKVWVPSSNIDYEVKMRTYNDTERDKNTGVIWVLDKENYIYEKYNSEDEVTGYALQRGNVLIEARMDHKYPVDTQEHTLAKQYLLDKFNSFNEIVNYNTFDWTELITEETDYDLELKASETIDIVEQYVKDNLVSEETYETLEEDIEEEDIEEYIEEEQYSYEEIEVESIVKEVESIVKEVEEIEYTMTGHEFLDYMITISDRFRLDEPKFSGAYHIDGTFKIGEHGVCYVTLTPFSPGNYNYETSDFRHETEENPTAFGYFKEIEKDTWEGYSWNEDNQAELSSLILVRGNVKITVSGESKEEFLGVYDTIKTNVIEEFSDFDYIVNYEELETLYKELDQQDELEHVKELFD